MRFSARLFNSTLKSRSYYVTTPIFYVNASPHIGHLYSAVIADTIQRFQRLIDPKCSIIFSTGTDEHGTKIQQAAAKFNKPMHEYCTSISDQYKKLFEDSGVEFTDFVRTTEERHKTAVQYFWNTLKERNYIYNSQYSGWYCVNDETFLTQSHLKEEIVDGKKVMVSIESGHPVEWTEEQNYMFRLSSLQSKVTQWLSQKGAVTPQKYQSILLNFINNNYISDISISRPLNRVFWSVQVPDDPTQGIYVWLDALVNYLTVIGYPYNENLLEKWPVDVHVIGKDILKFHALYWPAFLIAIGLNPPRKILCHSHWTVDGNKMSKSLNNVVNPYNTVTSLETLRYFLLREGTMHSDANYNEIKMTKILNSELADTLGNLLNRCTSLQLNPRLEFPILHYDEFRMIQESESAIKLMRATESLADKCYKHFENFDFYKGVDEIVFMLHSANEFFTCQKPWAYKNMPEKQKELDVILHLTLEALRVAAITLQPIIPNMASKLLDKLMITEDRRFWSYATRVSWNDDIIIETRNLAKDKLIFFNRIVNDEKATRKV